MKESKTVLLLNGVQAIRSAVYELGNLQDEISGAPSPEVEQKTSVNHVSLSEALHTVPVILQEEASEIKRIIEQIREMLV